MKQATYIGKQCGVRLIADEGSGRVTIDVDGRAATLSVESAERVLEKLRLAILTSS